MKKIFFVLLMFVFANGFSQGKYVLFDIVPESSPGACDGEVHAQPYGFALPCQTMYWAENVHLGNTMDIYSVCSDMTLALELIDSECIYYYYFLTTAADPDSQVNVLSVNAVLPTSSTSNDGSIVFTVDEKLANVKYSFGPSGSGPHPYTNDTVFTGLDDIEYAFSVLDSMTNENLFMIKVILNNYPNLPCSPYYDFDVNIYPASPGNCDGRLEMIPTLGDTSDYMYQVYDYGIGASGTLLNAPPGSSSGYSIAKNICPTPVYVRAINSLGLPNSYVPLWRVFYVGVDSTGTMTWSPPAPYIPADVDTILMEATYNCSLDYSTPVDTVYIDTVIYVGGGLYNFTITLVQDTMDVQVNGTITADTSGNFFIDFTLFCNDTTVTRDGGNAYVSMRHLVYSGELAIPTAVPQTSGAGNVSLYPNPADERVTISATARLKEIQVIAANGKIVRLVLCNADKVEVDLSGLPPSIYTIRYTNEQGLTGFARFVKL